MIRKLFSVLLALFACLLLMGAGMEDRSDSAQFVVEEEFPTAVADTHPLIIEDQKLHPDNSNANQTETQPGGQEPGQTTPSESQQPEDGQPPVENEDTPPSPPQQPNTDSSLLVDGKPVSASVNKSNLDGTTYVALAPMVQMLNASAQATWNARTGVTVTAPGLTMTAKSGDSYVVANGRYLYVPNQVRTVNDRVEVPLKTLTTAFGYSLNWNESTEVISIQASGTPIQSGDEFYNAETLFWLSRIIYAESGNQSLEGRMAVGNVVMNRVKNPKYPNTVEGVLAQKNQFTTYNGGALANRKPNEGSVIAAKLVMDGGEVPQVAGALYFDSASGSWASRNRTFAGQIGNHRFYY